MAPIIPSQMKAVLYNKIRDFEVVSLPVPEPRPHEVLIKVKSCGICGTDLHIHDGDFESRMPVVTGHETSGIVVKIGAAVKGFKIGDKVTADNAETCDYCHYCRQGKQLLCENILAHGVHLNGGFAEYCTYSAAKLFRFNNLSWEEASLFEATACAVHGMDRIKAPVGSKILLLGAGATGLCFSQLLKINGGAHVVIASNAGPKMDLARSLNVADEYVDFDRNDSSSQWADLKKRHPHGFDVVVEATGSHKILEKAIDYCTRGGTLVFYGVYDADALIQLSPAKVFLNEITLIGSFSQMWCLPRAVEYLESRKVDVRGIVSHKFKLDQFGEALQSIRSKECIKATIVMD